MKKIISAILSTLIVVSLSASAFAATPAANATSLPDGYIGWYITGSTVHIRATANGTSLGLVYKYDTCNNYGPYNNGEIVGGEAWREVEMTSGVNDGLHGYVADRYTAMHWG